MKIVENIITKKSYHFLPISIYSVKLSDLSMTFLIALYSILNFYLKIFYLQSNSILPILGKIKIRLSPFSLMLHLIPLKMLSALFSKRCPVCGLLWPLLAWSLVIAILSSPPAFRFDLFSLVWIHNGYQSNPKGMPQIWSACSKSYIMFHFIQIKSWKLYSSL